MTLDVVQDRIAALSAGLRGAREDRARALERKRRLARNRKRRERLRPCDECHKAKPVSAFRSYVRTCLQCEHELATPAKRRP